MPDMKVGHSTLNWIVHIVGYLHVLCCKLVFQASVLGNHSPSLAKLLTLSRVSLRYARHSDNVHFRPCRTNAVSTGGSFPPRQSSVRGEPPQIFQTSPMTGKVGILGYKSLRV